MRRLLRNTIESSYARNRVFLGWLLLTAALLTPVAVLLIAWQHPAPMAAALQAPPATVPSYVPGGKRDPFKSPFDKKKEEPKPEFDTPPPRNRRPPGPAGLLIGEAQLVGIVQGLGGKIAMIAGDGSVTYFLHEGDRLYDGNIREITENEVKFLREIKMNSRVVDRQEVVKRVVPVR